MGYGQSQTKTDLKSIKKSHPEAYELQSNRTTYSTVFNLDAAQYAEFEPRM